MVQKPQETNSPSGNRSVCLWLHAGLPPPPRGRTVSHLLTFLCSTLQGGPQGPDVVTGAGVPARTCCAVVCRGPLLVFGHPASLPPSLGGLCCGWGYPGAVHQGVVCPPGQASPGRWPCSRAGTTRSLSSPLACVLAAAWRRAGEFSPAGPPELLQHLLGSAPQLFLHLHELPDTLQ